MHERVISFNFISLCISKKKKIHNEIKNEFLRGEVRRELWREGKNET